jgi:hypothetical protein
MTAESATGGQSSRRFYLLAAGVLALAALLRLWHLGELSIGVDDGVSILEASRPLSGVVPFILQIHDVAPPLFLYWLHPWAVTPVHSGMEAWFRSAVAPWAIATVLATMAVGRCLGGERLALAAGVLTAVSGFLVYYAGEVRMYPMATACLLVATWAVVEPASPGRALIAALAALAAMFSHYLTVPYLLTLLAWRLARREQLWLGAGVPAVACSVALLLWSPVLKTQAGGQPLDLRPAPGMAQGVELLAQMGCGLTWPVPLVDWTSRIHPLKWLMFVTLACWLMFSLGRHARTQHGRALLMAMLTAPFVMIWGLSATTHVRVFEYKYFQFMVPYLMLAVAWPLATDGRRLAAWVAVTALVTVNLGGWLIFRSAPFYYGPQDWRGLLEHMRPLVQPRDFVVVHPSLFAQTVLAYAYTTEPFLFVGPGEIPDHAYPYPLRVVPVDGPADAQLLATEQRAARLWLLEAPNHPFVAHSGVEAALRSRWTVQAGFQTQSFFPANVLRALLLSRPGTPTRT